MAATENRSMVWAEDSQVLAENYGIHLHGAQGYQGEAGAMDAVPNYTPGTMVTQPSNGFLAQFFNYIDPTTIQMLTAPNKAAELIGEGKIGTWSDIFATFTMMEQVGQVAAYGDFNRAGTSNVNPGYEQRQQSLVQAFMEAGELETERAGAARLDWLNQKRRALVTTLEKWQNRSYFFGVAGIRNYGLMNDPALGASHPPTTGTGGTTWANKTALEIYNDFLAAVQRILANTNGVVDLDNDAAFVFAVPTDAQAYLAKKNEFGLSVRGLIKEAFPQSTIVAVPQLRTASGGVMLTFLREVQGQQTMIAAFSEKLRTHRVVPSDSSFRQKMTSGSWGVVVKQPLLIDTTIGVS